MQTEYACSKFICEGVKELLGSSERVKEREQPEVIAASLIPFALQWGENGRGCLLVRSREVNHRPLWC